MRTRTTLRRSGGRLVDRLESVVVVVSTGRSRSSRGSLHASPGCTVEEQASQGRHPLALSMGFRDMRRTSRRSPRSPMNRDALPTTPVARARRALFGDIRMASGVLRGAEEWRRERRVRERSCPTAYAGTRVNLFQVKTTLFRASLCIPGHSTGGSQTKQSITQVRSPQNPPQSLCLL